MGQVKEKRGSGDLLGKQTRRKLNGEGLRIRLMHSGRLLAGEIFRGQDGAGVDSRGRPLQR